MFKHLEHLSGLNEMVFVPATEIFPKNGIVFPNGFYVPHPVESHVQSVAEELGVTTKYPLDKVVSAIGFSDWSETLSNMPPSYVTRLGNSIKLDGLQIVEYNGLGIAINKSWRVALAKLNGQKETSALVLRGVVAR